MIGRCEVKNIAAMNLAELRDEEKRLQKLADEATITITEAERLADVRRAIRRINTVASGKSW